jgi:hypothetical protein
MYHWNIYQSYKVIKKCKKCVRTQRILLRGKWVTICRAGYDPQIEWGFNKCKYFIESTTK